MSKKLFSTERWKRYLKARQAAEERSAKRRRRRAAFAHKSRKPVEQRGYRTLAAPAKFSMVENPEATVSFLNNLRFFSGKYNLTLDLSAVQLLTADAVAALVATLAPLHRAGVLIKGSLPIDQTAQKILVGSGFFQHFESTQPVPHMPHGLISQERSKKVQPDIARDLIHFGMKALTGSKKRCSPSYRVLIESMTNTHNHALSAKARSARSQESETWWATVYADRARNRICFTFVDAGVGIFESVRLGRIRSLYRFVGLVRDNRILRDLLHGKVESSTGLPYRGKGLPAINRLSEDGRIESLIILANDVYANVSADEYRMLPVVFRGTMLYWEIPAPQEV
jgi:hypothetical protein